MELVVEANGRAQWGTRQFRCAIGEAGIRQDKREGDGATPAGVFTLRRILWRPDRLTRPASGLPAERIDPADGWCDDPADPLYNRPVRLPHAASHERLWRNDGLYDVIVVLGHNDDPVVPGLGSAIFLHVAGADFRPTAGCVALLLSDLLAMLAAAGPGDALRAVPAR
jgi:L,D-peptidoglycan transpeptidase YkuD (ErfK/YbiS/YcfS/YnhG family)